MENFSLLVDGLNKVHFLSGNAGLLLVTALLVTWGVSPPRNR
jgi:hypothetical protein